MGMARFNVDEIFEMAEQIERNGARFYRAAAEGFDDDKRKSWLEKLAVMEDNHEKIFREIRSEVVTKKYKEPTVFDPRDEAVLYLQAMADGHVFDTKTDPAEKLSGQESLAEVLRVALGMERDSIAFYVGLKAVIPAKLGQDKVDWIIREEMKHIALLSGELTKIEG